MHLGTKNTVLVIAHEALAAPKDLERSLCLITGTDMEHPFRLIVSWTSYTVGRTTLHLYSKPHIPERINAHILRAQQKPKATRVLGE